jgi:hypothetical protein
MFTENSNQSNTNINKRKQNNNSNNGLFSSASTNSINKFLNKNVNNIKTVNLINNSGNRITV